MRAVGYTEVFVMHKADIQSILVSDSALRANLEKRATKLLGDMTVSDPKASPKLESSSVPNNLFALVTPEYSKRKRSSMMPPPVPDLESSA